MRGSAVAIFLAVVACSVVSAASLALGSANAGAYQQIAGFQQKSAKNSSRSAKEYDNAESGSTQVSVAAANTGSVVGAGGQLLNNAAQESVNVKTAFSNRESGRSEVQRESSLTETNEFIKNLGSLDTSNFGNYFGSGIVIPNTASASSKGNAELTSSTPVGANRGVDVVKVKGIIGRQARRKRKKKCGFGQIISGLRMLTDSSNSSKKSPRNKKPRNPSSRLFAQENRNVVETEGPSKPTQSPNPAPVIKLVQNIAPEKQTSDVQTISNTGDDISQTRKKSTTKGIKGNHALRIIIHHPKAGGNQEGGYFKNTKEATQRTKSSKSNEKSASESAQVGSLAESASVSLAKQRELDAAQRARVTQTAHQTEILLTQKMAGKSQKNQTETYSRSNANSQSSAAKSA